ncbi:MAG: cytochrome c [Solirubrobacterales bacterium]|nr:cytochrome c [Solirubrobacterales bacterium]
MISARMAWPVKLLLVSTALVAAATSVAACGTETISVPKSQGALYQGAVLFNQRCSGCHTLSYAATHGSAANVRTAQYNNGPNFDQRCERPVIRVLYAIQNGGFSGAIMPQNVVVGQQAQEVARFVATYSGRKAPRVPGVLPCQAQPIGTIPALTVAASTATTGATGATGATAKSTPLKPKHLHAHARATTKKP